MRENRYIANLIKRVIELSEGDSWEIAVDEWEIVDCEIDEKLSKACVCGKENLKYLFTIRNCVNGNELYPIGSTCINKFERDDLNYEVSVYDDMFKLVHAVKNREQITLDSRYFSRKLLEYLYENDVFVANVYNNFDARKDYYFMLDMFNKHDKTTIYSSQQRKINAIIVKSILPFVHAKIKSN